MQLPVPAGKVSPPVRIPGGPSGPAPRTVFLHGVLASTSIWTPVASGFDAEPSLVLPLPGHFPWILDDRETASVLRDFAFLDGYRRVIEDTATQPVQIVGHSTGALVALKLATLYPEIVSRIVLVGSFPCGETAIRRSSMAPAVLLPFLGSPLFHTLYRIWLHSPDTFTRGLATAMAPGVRELSPQALRSEKMMLSDLRRSIPEALRQVVDWLRSASLADCLGAIDVPVTVVVSQSDPVADPAGQLDLARKLPNSNAVVCNAGHLPMLETPQLLRRILFSAGAGLEPGRASAVLSA